MTEKNTTDDESTESIVISADRLREVVNYCPESGVFTWKIQTSKKGRRVIGAFVGNRRKDGYLTVGIDGKQYLMHRLAWLYMTGHWPKGEIDHKNTIRTDNRWINLRDVSDSLNSQNQRTPHKNNKLRVLGVAPTRNGTFRAQITIKGRKKYLGTFRTVELAYSTYLNAKRQVHEGCLL